MNVADTCPNRLGLRGMQTCSFCDVWGSSADHRVQDEDLGTQYFLVREKMQKKYPKVKNYLVYFQAYTNTFLKFDRVRDSLLQAKNLPDVRGLVIGTRPDCLSKALLSLWKDLAEECFLGVELGVQSFRNDILEFYRRGHSAEDSLRAIEKLSEIPKLNLGLHLMFGAPGESLLDAREAARRCNELPIQNVKLHNLHVLKNTELEKLYQAKQLSLLSLQEYTEWVGEFLIHLSPRIAVHRLAGYAPRWEELVAPAWTAHKMAAYQWQLDYFRDRNIFQGKIFKDF